MCTAPWRGGTRTFTPNGSFLLANKKFRTYHMTQRMKTEAYSLFLNRKARLSQRFLSQCWLSRARQAHPNACARPARKTLCLFLRFPPPNFFFSLKRVFLVVRLPLHGGGVGASLRRQSRRAPRSHSESLVATAKFALLVLL